MTTTPAGSCVFSFCNLVAVVFTYDETISVVNNHRVDSVSTLSVYTSQ